MSDLQAIADRVEIEALRGEFTDAGMMRDYDRFVSLFTQDAVWRIPVVKVEFVRPAGDPRRRRAAVGGFLGGLPRANDAPGHNPARGRHRVRPCIRP
jgi:hypothetical protein